MQSNSTPSLKSLWWFTFIITALLYLATCQRGVSWQDSGMFQWRVLTGDYTGKLGLALAHPGGWIDQGGGAVLLAGQ